MYMVLPIETGTGLSQVKFALQVVDTIYIGLTNNTINYYSTNDNYLPYINRNNTIYYYVGIG